MTSGPQLRLGTRASALARWQADWVTARLKELGAEVTLVPISTLGDRQQDPITAGSSVGLFTKELQRALLDGRIDLAVHSLKDLPTDYVEGLGLRAVPPRGPIRDAIVCRKAASFDELSSGAAIGTGSLRRRAQLLHARGDLVMCDIRGNVDTRLRKLDEGQFDAIVLAEAGLRRLELADRITQVLPLETALPAVGQGALGLECRLDDAVVGPLLDRLDDADTHASVLAERTMMAALLGGCLAPIAAWGRVEEGTLRLSGRVFSPDGATMLEVAADGPPEKPEQLGRQVAEALQQRGAGDLIRLAREGA